MKQLKKFLYFLCPVCVSRRTRTVRYAFPLVFVAASFLLAAALTSNTTSSIIIETSQQTVRAGEPFSVNVYVYAHVPVNAVDISVEFPETQVEISGVDTGESVITLWTQEPYIEGDKVVMRGGTFRKGFIGKHLIATINAQAVDTGLAHIEIDQSMLLAGDGSGSSVSTQSNGLDVAKLFIANEDGSFEGISGDAASQAGYALEGTARVMIITDIDGDGAVTLTDISRFMAAWSDKNVVYDFNGDGLMTFRDFAIILADSFFK